MIRPRPVPFWRRFLAFFLVVGLGLSSAEVAWGDVQPTDRADTVSAPADHDSAAPTTPSPEAPPRHDGHDWDCPCLCACACAGATGATLTDAELSQAPVARSGRVTATLQQVPTSTAPEPLLRPPLL